MEHLGLLALEHRPIGATGLTGARHLDRPFVLGPFSARDTAAGSAGRSLCDAVQPRAKQVWIPYRSRLTCQ